MKPLNRVTGSSRALAPFRTTRVYHVESGWLRPLCHLHLERPGWLKPLYRTLQPEGTAKRHFEPRGVGLVKALAPFAPRKAGLVETIAPFASRGAGLVETLAPFAPQRAGLVETQSRMNYHDPGTFVSSSSS